jgi:beta-galactosidase
MRSIQKTPARSNPAIAWVSVAAAAILSLAPSGSRAQGDAAPLLPAIHVVQDQAGARLQVDGRDFMVYGMNWDYFPIGTNYSYNFWGQSDDFIREALDREMSLLRGMGVNAVRLSAGVPPRWVRYIYERYGIFTVLNHTIGRYGYTLDGIWYPTVDYSDPRFRSALKKEVLALVEEFRGTPGILMWLLGNENNYGLSWTSFEIEALPRGERDAARARHLYSLFGEIIDAIKAADPGRPVAMANGDVQYIDIIAQECRGLDVFGTNVYRGISARDLFQVVKEKLGLPVMFTEFGADAWNAREMREDQVAQARYLLGQWQEIYEQSSGKGQAGNAIGGLVFQWSDGWWKFGQESRLDIHDTNASWPNGGYPEDYVEGENNMNEEWWGICAKGTPDDRGLFDNYPRAAYYALRQAFRLDPYGPATDLAAIRAHFGAITPAGAALDARGNQAALAVDALQRVRLSGLRLEFETVNTGGTRVSTPRTAAEGSTASPAFRGFDHQQSFFADFEARPAANVTGMLSLNVLGNVPANPIDQIFYENRGRTRTVMTDQGTMKLQGIERVKVYRAGVDWSDRWFTLNGFYRTGHYHWGYEGDFYGLYREANYGENIDIYNGDAPSGVEIRGRKGIQGATLALGPQLWWGANPAVLVKYARRVGPFAATAIYHEDIAEQSSVTSSIAVPLPKTRKASFQAKANRGSLGFEGGVLWSGATKVGQRFQIAEKIGDTYNVVQDRILDKDALGFKGRLTWESGPWHWYGQGAYMGLVADGGPTQVTTYTGWTLKDSGSGNQKNVLTGLAYNVGRFQVSPNFLWQKPVVGPIPRDVPSPGRPRNVLSDPFAVRANRETVGAEFLVTYDPTPATWMWAWDNDVREDAEFATSLGLVVRHLPTTQDVGIGIMENGKTFAFPGAPPARDLWELHSRIVSQLRPDFRLVANLYAGTGEPNGDDQRRVERFGGAARLAWGSEVFETYARFNDWGPYDYHRDFNLTFPVQLMGDLSHTLGTPKWFGFPQTSFGVRGLLRTLDRHSPRYSPAVDPVTLQPLPNAPGANGREWEIRTYLHLAL